MCHASHYRAATEAGSKMHVTMIDYGTNRNQHVLQAVEATLLKLHGRRAGAIVVLRGMRCARTTSSFSSAHNTISRTKRARNGTPPSPLPEIHATRHHTTTRLLRYAALCCAVLCWLAANDVRVRACVCACMCMYVRMCTAALLLRLAWPGLCFACIMW